MVSIAFSIQGNMSLFLSGCHWCQLCPTERDVTSARTKCVIGALLAMMCTDVIAHLSFISSKS